LGDFWDKFIVENSRPGVVHISPPGDRIEMIVNPYKDEKHQMPEPIEEIDLDTILIPADPIPEPWEGDITAEAVTAKQDRITAEAVTAKQDRKQELLDTIYS